MERRFVDVEVNVVFYWFNEYFEEFMDRFGFYVKEVVFCD